MSGEAPRRPAAKRPLEPPLAAATPSVVARAAPAAPPTVPLVDADYITPAMLSPWRGSSRVTRVVLPTPKIGGKAWLLNSKGVFVLEEGYGVLRTIACTHIGSGSMIVHNGLPDSQGQFPGRPQMAPGEQTEYNGRPLFRANPVVMGSWMMDAGFTHGLTIQAEGGTDNNCAIATIVWLPHVERRAPGA